MDHIQINIEAREEQQEILISELAESGAIGFEQTDTHLLAYFNGNDFESYEVNKFLKGFNFYVTSMPKRNWNAEWENNFHPVVVEDFCAIRADFHAPIKNVQH